MIKFVYGILPAFVTYIPYKFVNEHGYIRAGTASGWNIEIVEEYKNDIGMLEHELTHVKQWYRGATIYKDHLKREIEAYKDQLKYYSDDRTELFAEFLSKGYGFNITREEAVVLLRS